MKHQRHFNDGYDTIYNESNSRERWKISNIVISSQTEYMTMLENKINTFETQLNELTSSLKLKGII
jgi:hypothetical protein